MSWTRGLAVAIGAATGVIVARRLAFLERRVDLLAAQVHVGYNRDETPAPRAYTGPHTWSELSREEVVEIGRDLFDEVEIERLREHYDTTDLSENIARGTLETDGYGPAPQ